jgi:hypothetical protein
MNGIDIRDLIEAATTRTLEKERPAQKTASRGTPSAETRSGLSVTGTMSGIVLVGSVRVIEMALILTIGLLTAWLYLGYLSQSQITLSLAITAGAMLAFEGGGVYSIQAFRSFFRVGFRMMASWTIVFLIAFAAIFLSKFADEFSRVWLVSWFTFGAGSLVLVRLALSVIITGLTRAGRFDRRTAIVGGGEVGAGNQRSGRKPRPGASGDRQGVIHRRQGCRAGPGPGAASDGGGDGGPQGNDGDRGCAVLDSAAGRRGYPHGAGGARTG